MGPGRIYSLTSNTVVLMASLFQYQGSGVPDSVRQALLNEAQYQQAIKNKLPLGVEGSGVSEGVRKAAQKALEEGYSVPGTGQAAAAVAEDVAPKAASSLFRAGGQVLGKAAGPAALLYDVANPEMLGDAELTKAQQAQQAAGAVQNMGPQMAADAEKFGRDVSNRTLDAGMGRSKPLSLMDPDTPQRNLYWEPPEQDQEPQMSPNEFGAPPVNPATPAQAVAKKNQDTEVQRQTLESGALQGLSTGAVSRPEVAEAVVKADVQRSGKELNPGQYKAAVATELTNMKSMGNDDVARYVSYALLAGGLLASLLDKTGSTGEAFSNSFNKQLDRNLASGQTQAKYAFENKKLAQKDAVDTRRLDQGDRGLDQGDSKFEFDKEYKGNLFDLSERKLDAQVENNKATLNLGYSRMGQDAAQHADSMGYKERSLAQRQADSNRNFGLAERAAGQRDVALGYQGTNASLRALEIKNKEKADALKANNVKGVDLTDTSIKSLVKGSLQAAGVSGDPGTVAALQAQVKAGAKNDAARFNADPQGYIQRIIENQQGPYETVGQDTWYSSPRVRQKKPTTK